MRNIREGRVTNYVLSTLSAVRIVVVLLFCCCTIRIRVRTWRLCSRFSFLFDLLCVITPQNLFVFLVGATIAHWSEIERQQRSEAKRYDTTRFTRFTSDIDTMWFFSTREISLCMRTIYTLIDWDGDVLRSASSDDFQLNTKLTSSSHQSQPDPARSVAYNRAREGVAHLSQHCATYLRDYWKHTQSKWNNK